MAAHVAARSYGNLSLKDIFGEKKSASSFCDVTKDISANLWNEGRFAVPPGTDVSHKRMCQKSASSYGTPLKRLPFF